MSMLYYAIMRKEWAKQEGAGQEILHTLFDITYVSQKCT